MHCEAVKKGREDEVAERAAHKADMMAQAEREAVERARETAAHAERELSIEAECKATRDTRYAARKERQRRR